MVFSDRVAPIRDRLDRVFRWADRQRVPIVATTCLQVGCVRHALDEAAHFVTIGGPACACPQDVESPAIFLERRSCGESSENVRTRAYDVFTANPHASFVCRDLGADQWVVVGVSLEYCIRTAVEGLLRLGQTVILLEDATLPSGSGTPDSRRRTLDAFRVLGVRLRETDDFLREVGGDA